MLLLAGISLLTYLHIEQIFRLLKSDTKICFFGDFISHIPCNKPSYNLITYPQKTHAKPYEHIFNLEKYYYESFTGKGLKPTVRALYNSAFTTIKDRLPQPSKDYGSYIVLLTDASHSYRMYPREKWQKIVNSIQKEKAIIQLGLQKFPLEHPNILDMSGETSLTEAMSLVINATLVIGNESGLIHLSYLSGVPTVVLLGGGHFGRFLPWKEFDATVYCAYHSMDCFQCKWNCVFVDLKQGEIPPCISKISERDVLRGIHNFLEHSST